MWMEWHVDLGMNKLEHMPLRSHLGEYEVNPHLITPAAFPEN